MYDHLRSLQKAAIEIAQIEARDKRHDLALRLEHECRTFDQAYKPLDNDLVPLEIKLGFQAVVSFIFDGLLYDALLDEEMALVMPEEYLLNAEEAITKGAK